MCTVNLCEPGCLYGDLSDEIIELLNMKPSELLDGNVYKFKWFKHIIFKHVERVQNAGFTIPPFGAGDWLNTSRALDFETDLKNRILVIDFFTLCCINCIHILKYLKQVESEHKETQHFAVIGIHSPKFKNEKNLEAVKEAVRKYDIKHPVLNDPDLQVWNHFGVYCWPTVFIVGPGHTLLFALVGEAQIDKLPFLCEHILDYFSMTYSNYPVCELPILNTTDESLRDGNEAVSIQGSLLFPSSVQDNLLFPGSVSTNGRILAVSDTGHNRILLVSKDYRTLRWTHSRWNFNFEVQEIIGSGSRGNKDGEFKDATFNSPNGSTWYGGKLYVADTGNHCIREIDFNFKIVTTVFSCKDASEKFQSPWDICMGPRLGTDFSHISMLYIAVAGSHQIWAVDLDPKSERHLGVFAGSGKEENRANLYRMKAGFAQPSGISYSSISPGHIYIADSESSSIKCVDLSSNGAVRIIVGGSRDPSDLFQFGDRDGIKHECKLQHPMGIAVIGKHLVAIADTYNHKIKIIDALNNECNTLNWLKLEHDDVSAMKLREPSGICFIDSEFSNELSEKTLYVCDTNNHRIIPIPIYESMLSNERAQHDSQDPLADIKSFNKESNMSKDITELLLDYDGIINCRFKWNFVDNNKINLHGCNFNFKHEGDGLFKVEFMHEGKAFESHLGVSPTLKMTSNRKHLEEKSSEILKSSVIISCSVGYCDESRGACIRSPATFEFSIKFSENGAKIVELFLEAGLKKENSNNGKEVTLTEF